MIKLNSLKADTKAQEEGEWQPVPALPGVELKVRSFKAPAVASKFGFLVQRMDRQKLKGVDREIETGRFLAEHVLLGWKGFDVPFSPEVAREALADPEHQDLRDYVFDAARAVGVARIEQVEDIAGN
ncbi:hypothetical protein UFOVP452_32 [uncultured Caudovirales phage]|uniref:Uncharacterized protein n=1 Tax=uncultured Caudovirales phage TaxID=2100421 RepID=A0A6J5M6R6_9CAUD|nr:hypothetical protein UFOVP452_32 [uncultured Caudovirales phage]